MKYKLMISDYDGTLNLKDEGTYNAIKEFQKRGGKFVICTGRSNLSIASVIKDTPLTGLCVSYQGATIFDWETGEKYYDEYLNEKDILDLYLDIRSEGYYPGLYYDEKIHTEKIDEYMKQYYLATNVWGSTEPNLVDIIKGGKRVKKLIFVGDGSYIIPDVRKYAEKYKGRLLVNSSSSHLLEAVDPKSSKGESVKRLAKIYNIPLEEVIAVGDSENDIELVSGGNWHGVAVGDGMEKLKEVADEITVPYKDNPIKFLLKKYCL